MKILVLNCGSSSIKYQLIDMNDDGRLLAKGIVERIGLKDGELKHKPDGKDDFSIVQNIPNHTIGIDLILSALMDSVHGVISNKNEIDAVGHRVAHGGENFSSSIIIDDSVIADIERVSELAPLHNPANLKGIFSMKKLLPEVPQVAVFDTSFHQTMPAYSYMYAIPYEYYEKFKVRRYGFHGTSHKYVAMKSCEHLNIDFNNSKIITCHLGNGASITAIKNGQSIDTSMGLTPVEGLMMGTRSGDLDLGALLYIAQKENFNFEQMNNLINKQSGLVGISGLSSDMRDLHKASEEGNDRAKLALDMFCYRVRKYIGAYTAAMGGVDLIVMTGGIGENDWIVRQEVCKDFDYLGLKFDANFNKGVRCVTTILSKPESKVKLIIMPTNEEFVIANDTYSLVTDK